MKKTLDFAMTLAASGAMDPAHLKGNKKQVAFKLAKTAAWVMIQKHPLFMALKLALYALAAVALLVVVGVL